jgi:hypothetical protein
MAADDKVFGRYKSLIPPVQKLFSQNNRHRQYANRGPFVSFEVAAQTLIRSGAIATGTSNGSQCRLVFFEVGNNFVCCWTSDVWISFRLKENKGY